MADVQSNEASTQIHDTPSSTKVKEQKCSTSKKQFGATDHVLSISAVNHKSFFTSKSERTMSEEQKELEKRYRLYDEVDHEYMFAFSFIVICNIIQILFFDSPEGKNSSDILEIIQRILIRPLLVYLLFRYIYIIVSFVVHKAYITYHAPTENIDLTEKKYFEGRKKCIESLLALSCVLLFAIVCFEISFIVVSFLSSTS